MINDVNVAEMRTAIVEATTQSKLALLAYSLLATIDGAQKREWDKIKAERPTFTAVREPACGDVLVVDGRRLTIEDVDCGPFTYDVKAYWREPIREFPGGSSSSTNGKRVWSVELQRQQIEWRDAADSFSKGRWVPKIDVPVVLKTEIVRTVTRRR